MRGKKPRSTRVLERVQRDQRIRRGRKRPHALDGSRGLKRFLDLRRA